MEFITTYSDAALDARKLESLVVSALPSTSVTYDFEDGETLFTTASGAFSVAADDGVQTITVTTAGTNEKVARGYIDVSAVTEGADSITLEYDSTVSSGGRLYISVVDTAQRPGSSSGTTHTNEGVVFKHGTKDGSYYFAYSYGAYKDAKNFLGKQVHVKLEIDFSTKKVTYSITDGTGTISGTNDDFLDTTTTQVTGLEFYSWLAGTVSTIDNIKITARTDAKENVRYLIANDDGGYDEYEYIDGEPVKLSGVNTVTTDDIADGAVTAAKLATSAYSTTPVQVGTWIDGTPVWRWVFMRTFTDEDREAIPSDLEYRVTLPITNQDAAFVVNAWGQLCLSDSETGELSPDFVDDMCLPYDAFGLFNISETLAKNISDGNYGGIYGWFEFVTAASNISTT